jgi:hypothetical protein
MRIDASVDIRAGLPVHNDLDDPSWAGPEPVVHRGQVARSGRFTFVLASGSTPHPTYERLAGTLYRDDLPWRDI